MQFTLMLLRHGEAESVTAPDPTRKLTESGRAEVREVARHLSERGQMPQMALTSDARRATETWTELAAELLALGQRPPRSRALKELYLTNHDGHAKVVADTAGKAPKVPDAVLVIGHNPNLSSWATILSSDYVALGTAVMAILTTTAGSWDEAFAAAGTWNLEAIIKPGGIGT